ncbi:HK97 gp10 family phage protein [Rhizobium deserti]|uniref:HK97 gp10 family phage protein n=1 Tax=Rhizobium deserti TaxID=2547961 RepID=A0A4R5ULB4_9HYPH|nr:HK97-gp10 family putative phage morphogenesis protein [Rhizobium deserti]TDK38605.1 HK97 gp10 family phage protein [Rhizobium deserti]
MADDSGLSRFQKRMRAIPQAARDAVVPAIVKGADEIAALQRQLAPEDTGALKESIEVTPPGHSTPKYSQPGGSRVAGELEALITVGDHTVRYPHLVEFGTADTTAQPFFWPGFRLGRKRAANRVKRAVAKAIRGTKK